MIALGMAAVMISLSVAGCAGTSKEETKAPETTTAVAAATTGGESVQADTTAEPVTGKSDMKVAFMVDRLGDNAANDESYRGMTEFTAKTGIEVTAVEAPELQDHEMNARTFAQEGYDLIVDGTSKTSELYAVIAPEFPDTHFIVLEGTVTDVPNVTCLRDRPSEAAFLVGAFNVLMNQELGGEAKAAFVGGVRNPDLERSQFGFTAGAEYVGGEATVVYVGNFSDIAKGKEIALQLYNQGMKVIQAFAGGAGMGVYQAAESMGEGYYALGAAAGQFHLSDSIIASQVKMSGTSIYDACMLFYEGKLEGGIITKGVKEGSVDIRYSPINEDKIPQSIKDQIAELREKVISGEIVPPMTEEEYKAFNQ